MNPFKWLNTKLIKLITRRDITRINEEQATLNNPNRSTEFDLTLNKTNIIQIIKAIAIVFVLFTLSMFAQGTSLITDKNIFRWLIPATFFIVSGAFVNLYLYQRKYKKSKTPNAHLLMIGAGIVLSLAYYTLDKTGDAITTSVALTTSLCVIIATQIKRYDHKFAYVEANTFRFRYILDALIILVTTAVLTAVAGVVFNQSVETSANQETINDLLTSGTPYLVWVVLTAGILAPISEELIFRRILIGRFNQRYFAIVIRSLLSFALFMGLHVITELTDALLDPSWATIGTFLNVALPYTILTIGFIYMYHRYQSMLANCVIHIIYNLSTLLPVALSTL